MDEIKLQTKPLELLRQTAEYFSKSTDIVKILAVGLLAIVNMLYIIADDITYLRYKS